MQNFLKILHTLFVKGPLGALVGLLGLLILLVVFIPSLLLRFCEKLLKFLRTRNFKAEKQKRDPCNPPFPEPVMRRPDPCIYSQTYLASQGVPVTWNNPDIWMAKAATPNVIEPDSYHLEADTDYLVSVQAHNASTDLALGVKVRLLYRPWSFNSPDLLPAAVNANGQEVVRFVNIAGMGSAIAQFTWHTPPVPQGEERHYCLQAHLSHPLDTNLENNVGQENTNVHSANPGYVTAGELVRVDVPLFNPAGQDARVVFRADAYAIDKTETIQLQRQTTTGRQRLPHLAAPAGAADRSCPRCSAGAQRSRQVASGLGTNIARERYSSALHRLRDLQEGAARAKFRSAAGNGIRGAGATGRSFSARTRAPQFCRATKGA
jgi:hypothetical protein